MITEQEAELHRTITRLEKELAGRPMARCMNAGCESVTDGSDYYMCQSCVRDLQASRSALEREVERLRGEIDRFVESSFEFFGSDLCDNHLMIAKEMGFDEYRQSQFVGCVACLRALLPRVAEATRDAAEAALIPLPRRSHVYGHECLFFERASRAILDLDVSAIITQVTQLHAGADEVREVDSK